MSRIAIFTGAGASKAFGFPLTGEILPLVRKQLHSGELFADMRGGTSGASQLLEFLNEMLPGFEKLPTKKLPLITHVLSLIDHAIASGYSVLPRRSPRDLDKFRNLIEWAILEVLYWPYEEGDEPELLMRIVEHILARHAKNDQFALISTNYDTAIETELYYRIGAHSKGENLDMDVIAQTFDFGVPWRDPLQDRVFARPEKANLHVYKLHGSQNWLRCDLCEHIYLNPYGTITHFAFVEQPSEHSTCYCRHARLRTSIVAPSYVRLNRDINLTSIWKAALDYLRTADKWFIIGYSLPPEDLAIRALLIKAYQSAPERRKPKVTVIELGDGAKANYQLFFPKVTYLGTGFEHFNVKRFV